MSVREKTISSETVYDGRIVKLELVDVELENGTASKREIIRHAGAVVILAREEDGRFVFVRQFRKPVESEMLELVAGTLEKGEDPETCARRELEEETGCSARSLRHLGTVYPSPGYVDERMEIYFAELADGRRAPRLDADEHVVPVRLTREAFTEQVRRGEIRDAKTLAGWLLYEKIAEQEAGP